MSWFKVDDKLTSHRKFLRLGRIYGIEARCMALGLWVQAGSWSALTDTNGFIPEDITQEFAPVTHMSHVTGSDGVDVREALCDVGLWSQTDDGYQFEGWAEYQPTKDGADEKRAKDAERKRRSRAAKKDVTDVSAVTDSDASAVTPCPPLPSRPVPTRPASPKGEVTPSATAGYSSEFEDFWTHYPIKKAKRQAWKAWGPAIGRATPEQITAGAVRYAQDPNRSDQYTQHGATWLNADGWEDEPMPQQVSTKRDNTIDAWGTPTGQTSTDFIDGEVVEFRRALP